MAKPFTGPSHLGLDRVDTELVLPDGQPVRVAVPADDASDQSRARVDRRRQWWSFGLGIVLIVALVAVGIVQRGSGGASRGALAGTVAPDFTLTSLDGTVVRLSDYRGKPVVLNFWASWCAPCREEAPALARVAGAEAGRVSFLGVDVRDQADDARTFIATYGIPYPSLSDRDGAVEHLFTDIGIPFTVFINADGTISRTWLGPLDERHLLAFVGELT